MNASRETKGTLQEPAGVLIVHLEYESVQEDGTLPNACLQHQIEHVENLDPARSRPSATVPLPWIWERMRRFLPFDSRDLHKLDPMASWSCRCEKELMRQHCRKNVCIERLDYLIRATARTGSPATFLPRPAGWSARSRSTRLVLTRGCIWQRFFNEEKNKGEHQTLQHVSLVKFVRLSGLRLGS
jgi:hypothetical protein